MSRDPVIKKYLFTWWHPSGRDYYIYDPVNNIYFWDNGEWHSNVGHKGNGYPGMYETEEEAQAVLDKYKDELL
jgi:hypothetical protein